MGTRRATSLLLAALLISTVFVSIFSMSVPVHATAGTVTLTPSSGSPGTVIFITSTPWVGHNPGESCSISANVAGLITLPSCTMAGSPGAAEPSGSFVVGNVQGGSTYVVFITATIDISAGSGFTVTAGITLSPTSGRQGQVITVTGNGFKPGAGTCTITSSPNVVAATPTPVCSVNGGMINPGANFVVGSASAAGYIITVTFGTDTPTAPFSVVTAPTLALSPTTGGHGLRVSVSGVGFSGSGPPGPADTSGVLTATGAGGALFSGSPALTLTTSGPFVDFTGTFTVAPTATTGVTYTVELTGSPAGDFATASFTVIPDPGIVAAPPFGVAGESITVAPAVAPFSTTDTGPCTMSSTPAVLIASSVCQFFPAGILFLSGFIVSASAPKGVYSVTVMGSQGDSATTTFTVDPAVTLNPTSGSPPITGPPTAPATEVTVTGTGFVATDTSCTLTPPAGLFIDTSGEPACKVNSSGQLSAKFKVGLNSLTGLYSITVTGTPDLDSPLTAPTFSVTAAIVLSTNTAAPSTKISFAGSGFSGTSEAPTSPCSALSPTSGDISGAPVSDPSYCEADANGNVIGYFTVLNPVTTGTYIITFTDTTSSPAAISTLTVTGGPIVALSPNIGPTGTVVTVTGSGFNGGDTQVTIHTSAGPAELEVPINEVCPVSAGVISAGCTFTTSSTAPGNPSPGYTIRATGNTGDTSEANFLLTATLTLTPNSGGTGTVVTMSGSGFGVSNTCTGVPTPTSVIPSPFFKGGGPATCTTDTNGILSGSFTVDAAAALGVHVVTMISGGGLFVPQSSVSAAFTVTQAIISLSPNTGSGGDLVHVTGTGFSPGDTGCNIAAPANVMAATPTPTCSISGGTVTGTFTIGGPKNPAGVCTNCIQVTGTLGDSAVTTLTVVPKISVTPNPAVVGTVLTLTGSNFAGGVADCSSAATYWPGLSGDLTVNSCAIDGTTFLVTGTLTLANAASAVSDLLTLKATGVQASTTLLVVPHVVTLKPSFGPVTATITVSGSGFNLLDSACTIGGSAVSAAFLCTISSGTLTGSFTVFTGATPGLSTVTVIGTAAGDKGTATFLVTPTVSLLPAEGTGGTTVLVTGSNFLTSDTGCFLSSSPAGLISAGALCAIGGGSLSGSFVVTAAASGDYVVFATGTPGGDTGAAIFFDPAAPPPPPGPSLGSAISNIYSVSSGLGFEVTSNAFDDLGAGFLIAHRNPPKVTFLFTDSTRVASTGQLLFSPDYSNAVVVAGPLANPTTAYYETHGLTPLTFSLSGGMAIFMQGATTVFSVPFASLSPTNDYFIMEAFNDGSHTVVVLYGIKAPGTLASGVYFDSFVITNTAAYTASAYIIHWQGKTPNVAFPTDTYTPVYHT